MSLKIKKMDGFKARFRLAAIVILSIGIALVGIYDLVKPIKNGCNMTYMYPTYIPISETKSLASSKYGLFLYHEGWKKIDYDEHLKQLNGVPVLFIPGNGGSYKQVILCFIQQASVFIIFPDISDTGLFTLNSF